MIRDTVLLTRVDGNTKEFNAALGELSLRLIHRPILKIVPIELDHRALETIQNLDLYDHIIFISTNAAIYGMNALIDRWPQWPLKLKWYAVGESTADRLRNSGIEPIVPEVYSSEGLLRLETLNNIENHRVLILRGLGGRETLKKGLLTRGASVEYLELYERHENDWSDKIIEPPELSKLLASIVYSAESLQSFDRQTSSEVQTVPLLVPSGRVAEMAQAMGYETIRVVQPTDASLVKELKSLRDSQAGLPD